MSNLKICADIIFFGLKLPVLLLNTLSTRKYYSYVSRFYNAYHLLVYSSNILTLRLFYIKLSDFINIGTSKMKFYLLSHHFFLIYRNEILRWKAWQKFYCPVFYLYKQCTFTPEMHYFYRETERSKRNDSTEPYYRLRQSA